MERLKVTRCKEGLTRKVDTNGCCFLCLQTEDIQESEVKDESVKSSQIPEFGKFFSASYLLRHLQVNEQSSSENSSTGSELEMGQGLKVNLCDSCEKVNTKFSYLCQKLESIQMEINHTLEVIHSVIKNSGKDTDLVQSYSKRMTSDPTVLSEKAFVDTLRKEIEVKSLQMQTGQFPRIQLTKTTLKNGTRPVDKKEVAPDSPEVYYDERSFDCDSPPSPTIADSDLPVDHPSPSPTPVSPEPQDDVVAEVSVAKKQKSASSHKKRKKSESFNCDKCDKTYKSRYALWRHVQAVHLRIIPKCDLCNKRFEASYFKKHRKICKITQEKKLETEKDPNFKFVCKTCGKRFDVNRKLWDHQLKVHKNANRYPCDLCDKKFSEPRALRNHWNVVHLGKKFCCGFCDKKYTSQYYLITHEKSCVNKNQVKVEPTDN